MIWTALMRLLIGIVVISIAAWTWLALRKSLLHIVVYRVGILHRATATAHIGLNYTIIKQFQSSGANRRIIIGNVKEISTFKVILKYG